MALVGILAVTVGVLVAVIGVLRLGWVAEFLSVPIISGLLGGVAVIIAVHQLPDLMGLPSAGGSTVHRVRAAVSGLHPINGWAVGIGVGMFTVVSAADLVDRRLPGALIELIASTIVVHRLNLQAHGVAVVGALAHHRPQLGLHGLSWAALGAVAPLRRCRRPGDREPDGGHDPRVRRPGRLSGRCKSWAAYHRPPAGRRWAAPNSPSKSSESL